ncbi:hypothetical protein RYD26_05260 [Pasteurellaceae bacterium LIM206]|nr:hypothetical protein [Pasteurellaceae bacterium LIM206]
MRLTGKAGPALKFTLLILLFTVIVFMIAHFAIQFGVQAGDIQHFLSRTWFLWLFIRLSIYCCSGYFLYQLQKNARNEQEKNAYKKLIRAAVIGLIVMEVTILIQLERG